MNLPNDIARCRGRKAEVKTGDWPFPSTDAECVNCARRLAGVGNFVRGEAVNWMEPPTGSPCPEKMEPKK